MLKAARKQARLSQEELANRVGVSQSRMSHMELHPGSINLEQLLTLFGALGLEVVVGSRPASASAPQVRKGISQDATLDPGQPSDDASGPEW
jgi:HTH-type transcriptional regulator/antitoxin HipB